jgi:hypothetical protein
VGARVVHEKPTHHASGNGKELRAILPADAAEMDKTYVGLVDQGGRRERVIRALGSEAPTGDLTQVGIHGFDQPIVCADIAVAPRYEPGRHILL